MSVGQDFSVPILLWCVFLNKENFFSDMLYILQMFVHWIIANRFCTTAMLGNS